MQIFDHSLAKQIQELKWILNYETLQVKYLT